ncbi:hypothetical protein CKO28_03420 [Rhodovibrio sodomensis]|uniref:DUF4340 domain-containing protein n=1 Tax=Rhodovibrio sodomensis TaxID=1088 RepID=A0ABS1D9P5_9PROT|nr:DUF4340 domain-containing protein [Rhodovibrio sodomensis]MBK1667095.1 hypothetical protein [Rhodovibrio sodomensis]
MRRRLITNLVLLVAVVVGGALVYFEPWAEPPKKQPRLADLEAGKVERVTITRSGESTKQTVLVRKDGAWALSEPFAMPAESRQVETLLEGLRQRVKDHFPIGDRDLGAFGLKQPSLRIDVAGTTIALGDKVPTERAMYAKVGETIYTVDTGLMRRVDQPATGYVARNLVPTDAQITRIESDSFKVARDGDPEANWRVIEKTGSVAKDAGKTLGRAWESAVASDVEGKQYTGDLQVDVRVYTASRDQPYRFARLGTEDDGNVAVTRPDLPVRYLVSEGMADRLFSLQKPQKSQDASAKADQSDRTGSSARDKS